MARLPHPPLLTVPEAVAAAERIGNADDPWRAATLASQRDTVSLAALVLQLDVIAQLAASLITDADALLARTPEGQVRALSTLPALRDHLAATGYLSLPEQKGNIDGREG